MRCTWLVQRCGVCRFMSKKRKQSSEWVWVDELRPDSYGIFRWFPIFNHKSIDKAKLTVKLCEAESSRPGRFRIAEVDLDRESERAKQTERALRGVCPSCGSKKAKKGRSAGFRAFKCQNCGHVWKIPGTRPADWAPEPPQKPSKASKSAPGIPVPKDKGKKARKAKKGKKKGKK